jgi:glycosyltransferase involved in cell wall biosynthesis
MPFFRRPLRILQRLLNMPRDYASLLRNREAVEHQLWLLNQQVAHQRDQLDLLKSSLEISPAQRNSLALRRAQRHGTASPLVSVNIATFNRARILVERSLPSILGQTYENLQVNVVGDCCTDETEQLVRSMRDPRVRFINLPARGAYPTDPHRRWMVGGTAALNHGLSMSTGDFITHLDDDDEHAPDRIEKLLLFALSNDCDFVWHPFHCEDAQGNWNVNPAEALALGSVTTSAIFYRRWLKEIAWDIDAHWLAEPGDWNRIRRMKFLGANAMRYPEPLLRHYRERNQAAETKRAAA